MAGDLEKFLQQAAERLAEKLNQAQNPKPRVPPPSPRPPSVRASERSRPQWEAEVIEADLIEPVIVQASNPRELGPDRLSNIDMRPGLAQEIGLADERMADHLQEVFDHDVVQLRPAKQGETEKSIDLQRRQQSVSPFLQMLQKPQTLSAAFLAGEIFKRKF